MRWPDGKQQKESLDVVKVSLALTLTLTLTLTTGKRNDAPHLGKWSEDSGVEGYEKAAKGS